MATTAASASPQAEQPSPRTPAYGVPAAHPGATATLESVTPTFAELAKQRTINPSLDTERRLGLAYLEAGVLDTAFDHFQAVLRLEPNDTTANEALARIWRDWGFSNKGLSHAYRAAFWAPDSSSAQNTLGTVLLKLGHIDAARERFEQARDLDPTAAYPLNNLCYLSLQAERVADAVDFCQAASATDPASDQVRNNLALALALDGKLERAVTVLSANPHLATAEYNQAVLLLASHQPERALDALRRARTADPAFFPALKLLTKLATQLTGH